MTAAQPHNWIGVWTLYVREVRRFIKVYSQTLVAPVVTTLLFLAIFTLALGPGRVDIGGMPFAEFLAPGLVMMAVAQNAFANTSSSLVISKVQGNIVDTLMPPLTAHELTLAIALGGATRGVLVGALTMAAMIPFVEIGVAHWGFALFHLCAAALLLSLIGVAGGIWSDKFDHIAAVTNFVVTPLAFLSGTFYTLDRLPDAFARIATLNPFFYMIDGFRYGATGYADASPASGVMVMLAANGLMWLVCWRMFATGYKLKA
ncbi:MAG: multidrug ABC transporter permease [Alphaproteobacteria bacterium]|nr:multidrug ABC transporter permease [Alphaproteobacteria bacterium]